MEFSIFLIIEKLREVITRQPSFELFGRESLVTNLEHQDEAQGNKDTRKALILKAKQMKMRYCVNSVCKNNSKKRPDLNFFEFLSEEKLQKKWSTFLPAIELTRSFSLRRTYTYALSISTLIKEIGNTLCGIKKVVNGTFPKIFNPQEVPSGTSERAPERKKNFKQVPVCRLMSL